MPNYIPGRQAAKQLGMHQNTLRLYADSGKINAIRTPSGQRRYDVESFVKEHVEQRVVCYCRVSSPSQRAALHRQVASLSARFPEADIIKDIGSALNYKRKGLKSILGRMLRGEKLKIVVVHRDRLARFGCELIEWIIHERGCELVVLNDTIQEPERELTADLRTLIHHFFGRLAGLRPDRRRKDTVLAERAAQEIVETLLGNSQVAVQRDDLTAQSEKPVAERHSVSSPKKDANAL